VFVATYRFCILNVFEIFLFFFVQILFFFFSLP
jgi:hypothetical protein